MAVTMLPQLAFAEDGNGSEGDGNAPAAAELPAPGKPVVTSGKITATSIQIKWNKVENATKYELFQKGNSTPLVTEVSGDSWTFVHENLIPNKSYKYYITATNESTEEGQEPKTENSEVVSFKTKKVITKIKGAIKKKTITARTVLKDDLSVTGGMGRALKLQAYENKKWKTRKTITLKNSALDAQKVVVTFPNIWWKEEKTKWRYLIAGTRQASKCVKKVTLTTKKYYQNPKKYLQLTNKISKHGLHYYTSPVKTNNMSTRKDHVETMIKRARQYLGDPYIVCRSGRPGEGLDCSGLVMQAFYAAGADLWPSNPYRHRFPKYEYESRRIAQNKKLKNVSWKNRKRGDLIFYSKHGIVIHIAIYLGKGKIIHSWPGNVHIANATNPRYGHICKVKRVFL